MAEEKFNGHNKFTHITNEVLRSWNQTAMFFNLIGDNGLTFAKNYTASLPHEHRVQVRDVFRDIQARGYDVVRSEVNRTLQQGAVFNA